MTTTYFSVFQEPSYLVISFVCTHTHHFEGQVLFHSGQMRNFYLLVLWQVKIQVNLFHTHHFEGQVLFHSGQMRHFYLLVLWQVKNKLTYSTFI